MHFACKNPPVSDPRPDPSAMHLPHRCAVASELLPSLPPPPPHPLAVIVALLRWTHCTLNQAHLLLVTPVWRCEAGLCDALMPVIVSPKCKAVAPSCGQVFSWEFYSGTVAGSFPQVHITDGGGGYRQSWPWETPVCCHSVGSFSGPGCSAYSASAL